MGIQHHESCESPENQLVLHRKIEGTVRQKTSNGLAPLWPEKTESITHKTMP